MGSRKRKKVDPKPKQKFLAFYKGLSINDKIAFKAFFYHYGRSRLNLKDLLTYPYFWQLGPLRLKQCIEDGYTWI